MPGMRCLSLTIVLLCVLGRLPLSASPVISEFMAANATTLKDGHDNYEDWIEVWNPDAAPVDLAGWRLTDTAANLGKFVFPTKIVPAGARLIVFASNRAGSTGAATHVDALGYLHTNFSLAKSGEYLALVMPDGIVKTTEFSPAYPAQVDDISYGPPATTEVIVNETTSVRYLVPASTAQDTASPNWRASNFSDAAWTSATGSGVGFEAGSPVGVWTLDEAAGATSAADSSGSGHAANLNGTGQTFGTAGHAAQTNTSLTFNGSGGLTVPFSAKLNPSATFTFAAWVYPTGGTSYRSIVTSRYGPAGAQRGYILYITPSNTWEFWTGTGSAWHTLAGGAVAFNAWTHIAIARDAAGNKRIYINGAQAAVAAGGYAANNVTANGFHLGIGDDTGGNFKFVGRIDDAAFFPSDIGTLLVQQHITGGAGSFPTPLYPAHFQTDVQSVMFGINPGIYTRHNFTVADKTRYASMRLRAKFDDAYVAFVNGVEVARRNFAGTRAYNSVADSDRADTNAVVFDDADISATALPALANGANTLAIHGLTRSLTHGDFLLAPVLDAQLTPAAQVPGYFAVATPGAANSGGNIVPGPAISNVAHTPAEPTPGQSVTVTAHVTPRLGPIGGVSMKKRAMYGAESAAIAMADAGPVPGATDGSRIFTGTIANTGGATARQMLRYYVTATDTAARTWREPYPVDLTNNDGVSQSPEYFGLVVKDAALTAGMPLVQWFTNDVANSDTRVGSRASAFYAGRFYDNIYVRQRGGYTSTGSQKFNFNAGDGVFVNAALGTVGEVNLNANPADDSFFRVSLAFDLYRTAGHAACEAFPVALYRNAAFQRMGTLVEQVDEDFLKRWGYDADGAMYKFVQRIGETPIGNDYSNNPAFGDTLYGIEKKTRLTEDWSDLNAFVAAMNLADPNARKIFLFKNLNLPNFVNFMALRTITGDVDVNRKNFYFYRDSTGSLEWSLLPWDKDLTLGVYYNTANGANPWRATNTYKADPGATNQWCKLWDAGLNAPELKAMVGRRLRTLMDATMQQSGAIPGNTLMEQRLEFIRATMTPLPPGVSVSGYASRATFNTWLGQHRTALYTTFGPASGYGMIPNAASANPVIAITTADANPATGTQDHEYLLLVNSNADDVDLTGWTLGGGGIAHTFKAGTVIPGTAVSATLNRAYVCNNRGAFRVRPGAPATAEFVLGNYDGALTARGGTVELRRADASLAATYALPVAPTAAQQQLRITELMFSPTAPTAAELAAIPTLDAEDFEYIELQNIGATPLTLTGFRFTDGVDFTFAAATLAPGERILICDNTAAFDLRYGAGKNRAGPWIGALDNSGERIRIVDNVGEEILDFTYDPAWFPPADAGGRSLVVRNAAPDYATYAAPAHWALSGSANGSPGSADADFANVYEGWRWDHFSAAQIYLPSPPNPAHTVNAALVGPAADAEGDLLANLGEYAFCRVPTAADNTALSTASIVNDAGSDYLAITFRRRHNALDLTYTIETTGNLVSGPWLPTTTQVGATADLGGGIEQVTFRDTIPQSAGQRFIRVRAVK